MRRVPSVAILLVALGCGGATAHMEHGSPDPAARVEAAATAWAELDARRAARLATEAIQLGAGDDARQIAARADLALGHSPRAIEALEGAQDASLLRLRARAQLAELDVGGAVLSLEAARGAGREEDPWTEAILPALRASAERGTPYEVEGDTTELTLESAPLPLVRVRVDAIETVALIGSGAYLAVLDPSVRAAPGAIDELTCGELRVRNVPHIVRSLADVRATLGVEVGMVIGADLLRRLHAVIDGPRGIVRLTRDASPPAEGASRGPTLMLTGSFLALDSRLGQARAWLTVDTAGLFTVALTPAAVETLGIAESEWQATDAGPAIWIAPSVRLGALQVEGIPLIRGLLGDEHARAVAAPVAGSVGWALLSQLVTRFARDALFFE